MRSAAGQPSATLSGNLNRLLSAAIVNPRFQRLLLTNPVAALAAGYNGETFQLTQSEYTAVTSLCVTTLREFAAQLLLVAQAVAPSSAESPRDFQFPESTLSGRENFREQPTTLPCKQESENAFSRFSAPARRVKQNVSVNEGYRSAHSTNTPNTHTSNTQRYES
jgi:hypothetical protein